MRAASFLLFCLCIAAASAQAPPSLVGAWDDGFAVNPDGSDAPGEYGLTAVDLQAIAVHPLTGEVVVGGRYIGGRSGLLRWTGAGWDPIDLGADTNDRVLALAFGPNGDLFVGGTFTSLRGQTVNHIARWTGSEFVSLGQGVDGHVRSLFYDTATSSLLVGGVSRGNSFSGGTNADGTTVASRNVIRWTGSAWEALGGGVAADRFSDVDAFEKDPVTGDLILSGDLFSRMLNPDGSTVRVGNVARWDGSAWSRVGNADFDYNVYDVEYVGGVLYAIHEGLSGALGTLWRLAPGGSWERLASFGDDDPLALVEYRGQLVVAGGFDSVLPVGADGLPVPGIAAYDPATGAWSALGGGIVDLNDFGVADLAVAGDDLWAGGDFTLAGGRASVNVARWAGTAPFDGVYATFRLDARRAEEAGLVSVYSRRGRYGSNDTPFLAIESGPAAGLYALAANAADLADSVLTATVLLPRGQRVRYGFGVDVNTVNDPRRILRDEDLGTERTWVFERGGRAAREVTASGARALPLARLDGAPFVPTPTGAARYGRVLAFPGNPDPFLLSRDAEVTVDYENLGERALVAGGIYRRGPGGAAPSGVAVVSGNTFWRVAALPSGTGRARLTFAYGTVADIYVPEDLVLLRRGGPDEPWTALVPERDLIAQTLSVTVGDVRGEWTLGSTTSRNPMTLEPPQAVTQPNPASGAFGVPARPRLEWTPGRFALEYAVYVWPQGQPRSPSPSFTTDEPGGLVGSTLTLGEAYSWQVVAQNDNGTTDGPVWSFTVGEAPDLAVTDVQAPATATGEAEITVRWTVSNDGAAGTRSAQWTDAVYLSRDGTIGPEDALLAEVASPSSLGPGERYRQSTRVRVPVQIRLSGDLGAQSDVVEGDYQILVRTDASRRETEADEGNNLTVGPTVTVSLPNLPDLRVTALGPPEPYCYYVPPPPPIIASSRPAGATTEAAAARTFGGGYYVPCPPAAERDTGTLYRSGGPLGGGGVDVTNIRYAYTWTGVNEGDGPARGGFEDALYFQETPDFNTFEATFLGVVQVDSTVNPGETYTTATPVLGVHDQVLPDSGYYFIRANWQQQAFEGAASDNNLYRSPGRTILRDLPPSDVAVEGLSAPASVTARDSLNVTFTIRNLGPSAVAQALVSYAVYLSEDDELTTEGEEADRLIGRSAFDNVTDGPLQPDGFETFTARLLAPDGEVGARTLFVVLDREGLINERIGGTLFTDNNVAQTTITLGPPALPDLTPADLTVPATATAGDPVLVRYEVRNTGAALRPPARRADQLYVSDQDVWPGREVARRLLYQDEREPLAAGDAYQRDLTPRLPRDLEAGVQYVYLVADADSTQPEADEANNVRRSSAITVAARPRPDLAVTFQTEPPTSAMSGETVRLGWRVENTGTRATSATSWTDAVLLSTDDEPSADDTVLGREVRIGALVPGASYTATLDVPLPADRDGTFTLLVVTDRGGDVDDASRENNNAAPAAPTAVTLTAPADLRVAQFTLTGTPQAGQPLRGVVEVVNDGAAIPAGTAWTDAWTLSPGTERGPGTATLLTEAVQGPLASGARYTHTVDLFLPDYASGSYLLAVTADSRARVTEGGQRENNTREERVEIELPPPVDLVVENVAVPADATPGQETTITYDLVNRGQSTFEGLFFDAVHLSEDATFEIEDPRLAFERRSLSLPPGVRRALAMTVRLPEPGEAIHVQNAGAPAAGSSRLGTEAEGIPDGSPALGEAPNALRTLTQVDQEAAGTVPNLTPGDYRAIVWTDVRGGVRETDNDNNRTASDGQIGVAIPALTLGQPEPVVLAAGIERYYRLNVPEGRDLRLSLGNPTAFRDEEFELFVAYDRVPTPGDFDAAFAAESALGAPELLVPSTRAGTYYVLVRNPYLLARFGDEADVTLTAEAFDFRLFSSTPDAGGTQGRVLATVRGAQLAPGTTFHLEGGGARVDGRVVRVVSSMEAQVEFDLQGAATGRYDIVAERASMTARLADGFEVQTPSAVRLREALVRPPALRFNERAALEAVVTNDGNVDLDVVVMSVLVPAEVMFSLTSEDFVGSILSPDAAPDPSATVQRGITIDVVLPDGDVLQMGLITVIARDLRIGESFTADLVSPQVTLLPGELAPFAITTRGYTREEFAAMIQENAPRILGEIDRSPDLLAGTPEIAALLATNNADAVAQIASNLDAFFASVGLTGDGPLRGSRTVTYTPQAGAPAALRVDLASLLATPQECADLGTAFGIGIGIPALIVGIILLPAELTALAVIGVIAGAISLAVALDSVINNRDWGLLGEFGLPASPLDLVPLAIRFACDPTLGSVDPNDILGPEGYGAARWIPRDTPIPYTIRFENDATLANAPAKEVIITQTLDEDLDLRSFRVERFGFGERSYTLPGSGRAYYTDRLDLRDSLGVFVDVATTLDVTSGEIRLSLRAIDPQTGALTQDPLGGFLPPNEDAPEGEGFFAYRIRPLETAPEAARIDAQASIVFDSNPPIETPPIFNTLDAAAPESRVDGGRVVVLDTSSVQLSWNSSDRGAGLASVALYARRADTGEAAAPPFVGASFEPIATGLTDSTFVFEGAPGAQYEFFTLATDFAGNTEPMKTTPDVAVVVSGENGPSQTAAETLLLQGYPNPTRGRVTIPFQVAGPGEAEIEVYDLLGRRVLWLEPEPVAEGRHTREVNLRGFAAGVYLYQLRVRDERGDVRFADTRRITVVR